MRAFRGLPGHRVPVVSTILCGKSQGLGEAVSTVGELHYDVVGPVRLSHGLLCTFKRAEGICRCSRTMIVPGR